jgi:CubicO group peptidase (beta-lactamase class C family)
MIKKSIYFLLLIIAFTSCSDHNNSSSDANYNTMYFPPTTGADTWETQSISSLGWNQNAVQPLLDYLLLKNTKSFMILVNGRIVMENYFNGHTATTLWRWNSAGKTLTSTVTGIAEQEGYINKNNKVSDYIGTGWTSAPLAKENLITCKNLLSMNSGLDDTLGDDVAPGNLQYLTDAGTRWAYHNVYVKLQDVVEQATGQTWNNYFNSKLRDKIGMSTTGVWYNGTGANLGLRIYFSNTRSMARFGLLALNNGNWNGTQVINSAFLNQATTTSQNINLAYGYLWWLNGKASYRLPQTQLQFNGSLIASGANDMFMALGKDDQKIYVIPSKKMVVIRMGDAADSANLALSTFDEVLWQKINALYQ